MAALGKIRSYGVVLIIIIGIGLFGFIAGDLFRSFEANRNEQRMRVGEVLGEEINVNDYQKLVDEYTDVIKMQQGQENLNEDQLNQVKDMVWNTFVQSKLVENEAKQLGLTVTDKELQNILTEGTNQMLMQTPFVNQQTGRFDVNALQKFLAEYKTQSNSANPQIAQQYESIYKYWTFIEKTLRQQTLAQKYQSLLAHCFLSNPIEAKQSFTAENQESSIQLATFPYLSINDSTVKVSNEELQAKYSELKPRFKQYVESRNIKYVDVPVTASKADRDTLQSQMKAFTANLATSDSPADVVRKSASLVNYLGVPVSKNAFPMDIAQRLDSMAVGQTYGPVENKQDNTFNTLKLVAKQQLPDSVQYRQIQVGGDINAARKSADSIYTALKAGANFEVIAKRYGQTGQDTWMTTRQYEMSPSIDNDTKTLLNAINTTPANEINNIALTGGNIIIQVVARKAMVDKYTAAVIKKTIDFSADTYKSAFNKFNSFVSANQTAEDIIKNATKNGYRVQETQDITTAQHYLAGIRGTKDAMKWLFEAEQNDVSKLYECGDNDHLLVVILDKINPIGYLSLNDPKVNAMVKAEVIKDKKAETLIAKAKGVNSIAAAKAKGAAVTTVNQVTFASPVFVATSGASEPAISGAVASLAKGKFSTQPIKGNAGVYFVQVTNKTMLPTKYNEKEQETKLIQKMMQNAGNFMNELYIKAGVVDNRYLF